MLFFLCLERAGGQIRHLGKKVYTSMCLMINYFGFEISIQVVYKLHTHTHAHMHTHTHTHTHTQSSKRDDKRNGELIPAMPFLMRPTRISYFMREKLGVTKILKAARSPTSPIDLKDITKPSSE